MDQKPVIIFRADGNSTIGLGHVMRCLALAELLNQNFYLKFAIKQPSTQVLELIQPYVHEVIDLKDTHVLNEELEEILLHINHEDIVVLDGYHFDATFQKKVKSKCSKLVYIDDLLLENQVADVIINHSGNIKKTDYKYCDNTRFYLGPKYALLRKAFFSSDLNTDTLASNIHKILINLGGADPNNISLKLVENILSKDYEITVILGVSNTHKESFDKYKSQITVKYGLSTNEMVDQIKQCDLAIVSCSTISYEVASLNKPFIALLTAQNQLSIAHFLKAESLAIEVFENQKSEYTISEVIDKSKKWIPLSIKNQKKYFDGKAPDRIREIFKNLYLSNLYRYRKAKSSDVMTYFDWTNDPETRKNSFTTEKVELTTHTEWFTKRLNRSNTLLLIFENLEGKPVGQVRIEQTSEKEATIGISIDSEYRGKSLASFLIDSACNEYFRNFTDTTIVAQIKSQNSASIKAFERAGFVIVEEQGLETDKKFILELKNV